jgi:Zn-dependent protease
MTNGLSVSFYFNTVIAMKDRPRNSYEEAVIALGGPVVGTAAAVGAAVAGNAMDSQLLIALADWGYMINLFNLLPIGSLDGGRIANAISPSIGVLGLLGGGAMIYYGVVHNPIFYLIMLSGAYTTGTRFFGGHEEPKSYYKISGSRQASLLAAYLGLIAALIMAMHENNKRRKTPRQLQYERSTPGYESSEPWARDGGDGVYDDFFSFDGNTNDDDDRW